MIVTYKPAPAFVRNIQILTEQVGHIIVVDNGSSEPTVSQLRELETQLYCSIILNQRNIGIAAALNLGVKQAIEAGFRWIALFDQDSTPCDGFISQMLHTYKSSRSPEQIALIAPTYIDRNTGVEIRLRKSRDDSILVTMTSGSVIPSAVVNKLGFFDESLFIDAVDTEFCLRARRQGMSIVQSPAVLFHSLGKASLHYRCGHQFRTTNHSSDRRYYITRNGLRLLIRYSTDWEWAWREVRAMVFDTGKIILAEDHKWVKLRAIAAGISDALTGKMGGRVEL